MDRCLKTVILPIIIAALLPTGAFFYQDAYFYYWILSVLPGLYIVRASETVPHQRFTLFGLEGVGGPSMLLFWVLGTGIFLLLNILIIVQLSRMCKSEQNQKVIPILVAITLVYSGIILIAFAFLPLPIAAIIAILRRKAAHPM